MDDVLNQLAQAGLLDAEGVREARAAVASGKSLDDAIRAAITSSAGGASEDKVLRFLGEYFALHPDRPAVDAGVDERSRQR
jgi:hypothetical protein